MKQPHAERPIGHVSEREALALSMKEAGKTLADIGAALGVSRSQARVVVVKALQRRMAHVMCPPHRAVDFLGSRAVRALANYGPRIEISDPEAHMKAAKLTARETSKWQNFGHSSARQIEDWLSHNGLTMRHPAPKENKTLCPRCGKRFS